MYAQALRDSQLGAATEHSTNGSSANGSADGLSGAQRPVLHSSTWEAAVRAAPQVFPRSAAAPVPNRLRVFSGTSNPSLSQEVAHYLGMDLGKVKIKRFADGEIYVQVRAGSGGGWQGFCARSAPCSEGAGGSTVHPSVVLGQRQFSWHCCMGMVALAGWRVPCCSL